LAALLTHTDFLEPFLLPALVEAVEWASHRADATAIMLPIFTKESSNEIHQTINKMLTGSYLDWSFQIDTTGGFQPAVDRYLASGDGTVISSLHAILLFDGPDGALNAILKSIGNHDTAIIDLLAVLICLEKRNLRDMLCVKVNMLKEHEGADNIVHLYRRVEAYASVLIVQDLGMEFLPLNNLNIDTANANLDVTQDQSVDDIDRVLNESAVMNSAMDQSDISADVNMDDFYGLQGDDNMALGSLDDLDLDMF
jgi:hypothetical protein